MKLLTIEQRLWFMLRPLKVGGLYPFPLYPFDVYSAPNYGSVAHRIDIDLINGKDLSGYMVIVKEIREDFCRCNISNRKMEDDFWMENVDLQRRSLIERYFLYLFCAIPMVIKNQFTK